MVMVENLTVKEDCIHERAAEKLLHVLVISLNLDKAHNSEG